MSEGKPVVCFDIGGVLVQIRHTWDAAVTAVGMKINDRMKVPLNDAHALLEYQDGALTDAQYGERLAEWLNSTPEEALEVHAAILDQDYPGALDLVKTLQGKGVFTCCFSNTNAHHWARLSSPEFHPAVAGLDALFASHELRLAKPLHSAFETVESKMPPHSQVVFFDDTLENVEAANECGWNAYQVDPQADPIAQMHRTLAALGVI
jgi:HAD superfamily hydrolase (TIGR01509 family)